MLRWPLVLFVALFVVSCDDALDLRVPEGQLPDAPIAVLFHPENASYLELRWTRIPRATGYHIYSSLESDGEFTRVASVRDTVWRNELCEAFAEEFSASFTTRFYTVSAVVDDVESIPSGQAGATKLNINGSGTPGIPATLAFGLPMTAWRRDDVGVPIPRTSSSAASDVFGGELRRSSEGNSDQIRSPNDSTGNAWRDEMGIWRGSLAEGGFPSGTPCGWYNFSGSRVSAYICGFVQNGALTSTFVNCPVPPQSVTFTAYVWRESRSLSVDQLGLLEAGFNGGTIGSSDRITQTVGGAFAYYSTSTSTWSSGTLREIVPGQYYNISRKICSGYEYYYRAK